MFDYVCILYHDHVIQMPGRLQAFCGLLTRSQQNLMGFFLFPLQMQRTFFLLSGSSQKANLTASLLLQVPRAH